MKNSSKLSTIIKTVKLAYQGDKFYVIGLLVSSVIKAIAQLGELYSAKLIIDAVTTKSVNGIYYGVGLYLFSWVTLNIMAHFKEYLGYVRIPIINNYVEFLIINKIDKVKTVYLESSDFNDLYVNIQTFGKRKLANTIDYSGELVQSFSSFVISLIAIATNNYLIGLVVAGFALVESLYQTSTVNKMKHLQDEVTVQRKEVDYLTRLTQDIKYYFALKVYELISHFSRRIVKLNEQIIEKLDLFWKRFKIRAAIAGTISNIFGRIAPIGYFALQAVNGMLSAGNFIFLFGVINNFYRNTFMFYASLNQIYENSLYLKDLFMFLEEEEDSDGKSKLEDIKNLSIEFRNVSFKYPNSDVYALKNVSFKVDAGDKLAVVGANGAGKTTLVKLIAKYYTSTEGNILVNDIDINEINTARLRNSISFMTQDILNLYLTVKEDVMVGDLEKGENMDDFTKSVEKAALTEDIERMRRKENTRLGQSFKNGINLSGGQWQKLALARAFYRNASLVILDEPTSSIDSETELQIFENIFEGGNGKGYIIVSHKFSNINRADKVIVLDKGEVVEQGSHNDLMKKEGLYHRMYSKQKKAFEKK